MRTEDWRSSDNVEDRRGEDGSQSSGFGLPGGAGGLGIGTIVVLGLVGWALGIDPRTLIGGAEVISRNNPMQQTDRAPIRTRPTSKIGAPNDEMGKFVAKVLAQNEDRWKEIFAQT